MPLAPLKNRAKKRETKKSRALRRLKVSLVVLVILVLLIAGLAALYIWLKPVDKKPDQTTASQSSPVPQLKAPPKLADNIPFGSAIQSITNPVAPGDNASVTLRSLEGATCSIKVVRLDTMNKEIEKVQDSGLADKKPMILV